MSTWFSVRFFLLSPVLAAVLASSNPAATEAPAWFVTDRSRPYSIYDAWKELSAPEAVLFDCCNSNVIAGVLKDQEGKPLPHTPLLLTRYFHRWRRESRVRTDGSGYFIIYSPARSDLEKFARGWNHPSGHFFSALPGHPFSDAAYQFASRNGGLRECEFKLVAGDGGRAFYELTVSDIVSFDPGRFNHFISTLEDEILQENKAHRDRERQSDLTVQHDPTGRERIDYTIRLVSPEGKPIPNATVRYYFYDGYSTQQRTVLTDSGGFCQVHEDVLPGRDAEYESSIKRRMDVNELEGINGPLRVNLRKEITNVVTVPRPARLYGSLRMSGAPFIHSLSVHYTGYPFGARGESVHPFPDGRYSMEQLVPGEPFQFAILRHPQYITTLPRLRMEPVVLEEGEQRELNLEIPFASAAAISLVDEQRRPITNATEVRLNPSASALPADMPRSSFYFFAPLSGDHQIEAAAKGYLGETVQITLQPGELRFLELRLKVDPARFADKPLREWLADLDRWGEPKEWAQEHLTALGAEAIPELLRLMSSPDLKERLLAAHGFVVLGPRGRPALSELLDLLGHYEQGSSIQAIVAVGSASIPHLIQRLSHHSVTVRRHASWGLGQLKAEQALPELILALDDPDTVVKLHAMSALAGIGKESAKVLPLLEEFLTHPLATIRSSAANAISWFGQEARACAPAVAKLLQDEDERVRRYATEALKRINPKVLKPD